MKLVFVATFVILGVSCFVQGTPVVKTDKDWWKNAVFYQIYPRSFKDSDNDGIGDLKGITSKLNHLKDAGITAAWLSPIYKSPQVDAGYDISDFKDIHYEYGTMADFEKLLGEAKKLGIKIVMDLVPNHSSDEHVWFTKSAKRAAGFENYYVWRNGRENNTKPPNNWISFFHGPAWHFNEDRGQWYLAQFAKQQPDLNYREPKVVQEMKDVMTFWLDKGVDGFRVDAIPMLFETNYEDDEPQSFDPNCTPDDNCYLRHIYTSEQPGTFDMVYQWRALLDAYSTEETKVMMTEAYSNIQNTMRYYGNETVNGAHFSFNFLFITDMNENSSAQDIALNIHKWMTYMPIKNTANWVLGNHDQHRVATRYGKERVDGLNMLSFILPGVKVTYNGEEFGMEDGEVTYEEGNDPQGCNAGPDRYPSFTRDPERTPFQWDSTINAGFNEGAKTWLPVSDKYLENNLELQSQPGVDSHYHIFQKCTAIRSHETLKHGDLIVKPWNSNVLLLKRELPGSETFVFAFNIANRPEKVDLNILGHISQSVGIEVASSGSADRVGTTEKSNSLSLGPYEALIMKSK